MILSIVSYERKNIIFYDKNLKLRKNNYFNNVFCNQTFSYCCFLSIFKKCFNFDQSRLIFSGKTFSTTHTVSNFESKFFNGWNRQNNLLKRQIKKKKNYIWKLFTYCQLQKVLLK